MKRIATLFLLLVMILTSYTAQAQEPVATPQDAIAALLNRIGGKGTADRFAIEIDPSLAENGKDVFVITAQGGKPCIKGNSQLSVATGINWYLNHHAHINLTWNNLTTDLVSATLPLPAGEEKHVCNTTYRYNFDAAVFSYSTAFWTWERWQKEIDWMALHGINAPLNLVGYEVVTRNFLRKIGVNEEIIKNYITGPGYLAFFATSCLEGLGSHINVNGTYMNGNPDWWYERQEKLSKDMLQRMRELGMQPVIPGFSGQIPDELTSLSTYITSGDILDNGKWAKGGYERPNILKPGSASYNACAEVYYEELEKVMGVSELYNITPFYDGALPTGITNEECYPNIMDALDSYHTAVVADTKASYNIDENAKWFIQYWNDMPQSGAFSAMSGYGDRFVALDLNAEASRYAKWDTDYFAGRPYIFCMLNNSGGHNGMFGRLESTMNSYFNALANGNNIQGIGATPEGIENNTILYEMLFELPWMDPASRPTADKWLEDYTHARYGTNNATAVSAMQDLKNSVWNCPENSEQRGASEAVILACPTWEVDNVSTWGTSKIFWDTNDILSAADKLISIKQEITSNVGTENYNHDLIDVVRQALVDYAAELLPLINSARLAGNTAEYRRLYELYLQLMLDLDNMLSYCEQFSLSRWTSSARSIADEVDGTTENDRNWLEWNARTIVTVWGSERNGLHDYSSRSWSGLIKDYYYRRWSHFFEKRGNNIPDLYFCTDIEYPWTTNFTTYNYSTLKVPTDMPAGDKAASVFGKYFGRLKSNGKTYLFPMGTSRDASNSGVVVEYNRGESATLPFEIGKSVLLESLWIDLNNDGVQSGNEMLTVTDNSITVPADAEIGNTKAVVKFRDSTIVTFRVIIKENITDERTVTVKSHHRSYGTVAIEGVVSPLDTISSTSSAEAVKLIATAKDGYNFSHWSYDGDTICISTDNPYTYYDKAPNSFVAHFVEDKWHNIGGTITGNDKFVEKFTFAFKNREPETIYETTEAPTEPLTIISDIIDVSHCASFDIAWNGGEGLNDCYLRAYIDLNKDGDFDDPNEYIQTVNENVSSGKINVLLPYTHVRGITHLRMRFDDKSNTPESIGPEDDATCPVYDIVINLTDYADYGAHINVATNNKEWGSVRIYNNDTPASSNSQKLDIPKGTKFTIEAILDEGAEFLGWYDQYNRLLSNKPIQEMYAHEDATYTARIRRILVIDGWHITFRTVPGENGKNEVILSKVLESGNSDLVIPETVIVQGEECNIVGFDNDLFNNNKELTSITLPKTLKSACSLSALDMSLSGSGTTKEGERLILDIPDLYPDESWTLEMDVINKQLLTGWGTCLAASGENPTDNIYNGGFQLYLQCQDSAKTDDEKELRDALIVKLNGQNGDHWRFDDVYKENSFKVFFEYNYTDENNNHLLIYVLKANGDSAKSYKRDDYKSPWEEVPMEFDNVNFDIIKTICTDLAIGVDIPQINIERKKLPDPFRGCSNLEAIYVDEENSTYESIEGCLHEIGNVEALSIPEALFIGPDRRALREIIEKMEALSAQVATYSNTGGESLEKVNFETSNAIQAANYDKPYIWTNATDTVGNIDYLVDGIIGEDENYFQTNSGEYIEVFLGNNLYNVTNLRFRYHTRSGCDSGFPDEIKVDGVWEYDWQGNLSPEDEKWPQTIYVANGLPQEANKSFTSEIIDNGTSWYNYIRFYIESEEDYWHMGEFELFIVTQNGASVEIFDIFKNVITDEFMLGCFNETFSAKDVYANSVNVSEIQGATNTLQIKYDELLALVNGALPFELTFDDENPVLYNIQHKRTGGVIEINHLTEDLDVTHKLSIVPKIENRTFQAFYFKSYDNGIAIYPYNTDEEVLCSNDTNDGSDKVTTAKLDDENYAYKYWSIPFVKEENSTRYYNIMTNGTYLNDYSDNTESLGFKGESSESNGSLFNFVKAEFGNDNPRYYQLKDHYDMHPDGKSVFEGTSVGLYKGGKAYREAYAAASAIIERGNTVDSKECYEAHEALHKATENLTYNDADPDKLYHIMSVSGEEYCKGQFLHTLYSTTTHSGGGLTDYFSHKHLLYCESMNITPRPLAIFQFEKTNIHNEYKIKNLHTGLYITSFDGTHMGNESEAAIVRVDGYADGQVTLTIGENTPMHAQLEYGVITEKQADTDNASLWSIDEITDITEVYHAVRIGAAGYSTLYLNYPVEIPFGIIAYTERELANGWLIMDEITDGIIPARTPVILEANQGTYIFQYTNEPGTINTISDKGFTLKGTVYDEYIEKESSSNYHVLSVVDGEIGMYRVKINKDENGNSGSTHFLNNANKIYLKINTGVSYSNFIRCRLGGGNITEIDEVEEAVNDTAEPIIHDLQGRRIEKITQPGLYIVNGKKILIR